MIISITIISNNITIRFIIIVILWYDITILCYHTYSYSQSHNDTHKSRRSEYLNTWVPLLTKLSTIFTFTLIR